MKSPLISGDDFYRLRALVRDIRSRRRFAAYVNGLERRLRRSAILAPRAVPPDAVTMNSRLWLYDLDWGTRRHCALVYPHEYLPAADHVSVLSELGTAILGARVGERVKLCLPSGTCVLRVDRLVYQPEAAGDYYL